jgi:hypothetical protein
MQVEFSQKTERKGLLSRPKHGCEVAIETDLTEVGCEDMD